jgi:hypothetical protein
MGCSRDEFLSAAVRLAGRGELATFDAAKISAEAGAMPAQLHSEFGGELQFCEALHRHHLGSLLQAISAVIADLPPGWARLEAGINTFWDYCLASIPERSLVKQARRDTAVDEKVGRQNRAFAHMLSMEMRAMEWSAHEEAARLCQAMTENIAQAEFEARAALPRLRAVFWLFAQSYREKMLTA